MEVMPDEHKWTKVEIAAEAVKLTGIVIGVLIAVWELVLKDRAGERLRSETAMQLMQSDFSSEMIATKRNFLTEYFKRYIDDENQMSREDALEIEKVLLPEVRTFVAWEACFAAGLCDEEMGKRYICARAGAYKVVEGQTSKALGYNANEVTNPGVNALLKRCREG